MATMDFLSATVDFEEKRSKVVRKELHKFKRWARESEKLRAKHKELCQVVKRGSRYVDSMLRDPDLAALLGLLYIHQHSTIFQDLVVVFAKKLFHLAEAIRQGGAPGLAAARRFLASEKYRAAVEHSIRSASIRSDSIAQRKLIDLSGEVVSEEAQAVDKLLVYTTRYERGHSDPSHIFGPLSDSELELVLHGITSEPFVDKLLVPCLLPDCFTHQEKVQEAVEHARLMLLGADSNIFYGCSFKYSELKEAALESSSAKEKLHASSSLLWYMLRNPSTAVDNQFRHSYLFLSVTKYRDINVLHPEDFPEKVPEEYVEDLSEIDLPVVRLFTRASVLSAECMADDELCSGREFKDVLRAECIARERVCEVHKLIDKVSPTPTEVYEALILRYVEGVETSEELLKRKREVAERQQQRMKVAATVTPPLVPTKRKRPKRNDRSASIESLEQRIKAAVEGVCKAAVEEAATVAKRPKRNDQSASTSVVHCIESIEQRIKVAVEEACRVAVEDKQANVQLH